MSTPSAQEFFRSWEEICAQQNLALVANWHRTPMFTAQIFTAPKCVIDQVAKQLNLKCYCGYYHIDAVFYQESDLVERCPPGTTWLRRIRVAFEHENDFKSGLFQEVSHLLLTDCDLRVLVTYPPLEKPEKLESELKYLQTIIAGGDRADQIEMAGNFLFIAGWPACEGKPVC